MIHLTEDDCFVLFTKLHPVGVTKCYPWTCRVCDIVVLCDALTLAAQDPVSRKCETRLYNACVRYRDYTDKVCDAYSCPNCPNYSWCTTLRGIAIEGVKLDEY